MIDLAAYWKANKRQIFRNWRLPHIQERYQESALDYVRFHMTRMRHEINLTGSQSEFDDVWKELSVWANRQ